MSNNNDSNPNNNSNTKRNINSNLYAAMQNIHKAFVNKAQIIRI